MRGRILIVGVGRMGWAIARQFREVPQGGDLEILLYDPHPPAHLTAARVRSIASWVDVNRSPDETIRRVRPDLIVHAAPFHTQAQYVALAEAHGVDIITLGQDTDFVRATLRACRGGRHRTTARIVLDHGLAPGFLNILGADLAMDARVECLDIFCGGLPLDLRKGGVLRYGLSFSIDGLLQEYTAPAYVRIDGRLQPFHPLEPVSYTPPQAIPPFVVQESSWMDRLRRWMEAPFYQSSRDRGQLQFLEAAYTADGLSAMPWDPRFRHLRRMTYQTLRYAGHFDWFRQLYRRGVLDDPTVRTSLARLPSAIPDMVLFRVQTDRRAIEGIVLADEILDAFPDLAMGWAPVFSAMQHLTGWPVVWTSLALLGFWSEGLRPLPDGGMGGRRVDQALQDGGVLLPYEFVNGWALLEQLRRHVPAMAVRVDWT